MRRERDGLIRSEHKVGKRRREWRKGMVKWIRVN